MLDNYLGLEKLRFNNGFEYRIECDTQLDVQEVSIPPMLVQPFVENAVIHGMKNMESGGRIQITFEKIDSENLRVIVADNGRVKPTTNTSGHKSYGVSITSKRLAYNNKITNETFRICLLYTSPSPRDATLSRMPSSA